ncbi:MULTISPECIES: heparinase II/III family protein [unclassified Caulobacter]|uniref:heparinase II/III family protein n=1 Tax=unclassified Caulobacter TaxID=2648921 RepID=UPI0006F1DE28|nr:MULTISPECIES: heparinase II/III family protein [unclassified Caulobacter]KQV62301.1 heparinase [Caulobacter sp. Root342]KQV65691.1 heparinase [Caulobacter sp. Root343]
MAVKRSANGSKFSAPVKRGDVLWRAIGAEVSGHVVREWYGSGPHRLILAFPRPEGLAARPHDPRPADADHGRKILAGVMTLDGGILRIGPDGDPFDIASPSRRFAVSLHRFDWLPDLVAAGSDGARRALRLLDDWRRVFGKWNGFSWSPECLERRVFNLACAAKALAAEGSDAEIADLTLDIARQGRHLVELKTSPERALERAVAATIAGCVLAGKPGEKLIDKGLKAFARHIDVMVLADGGHATRSPEAGVELLFDLLTLDDALGQRGRPSPESLSRAIDRLSTATRFFTLGDGHLAAFHGGEAIAPAHIAAALAHDDAGPRPLNAAPHSGYQKMVGGSLEVIADCGRPPAGSLSVSACAQPAALEIVCAKDRLITSCGWSPEAAGAHAFRLSDAASTVSVGDGSAGRPLSGFRARALGAWLVDGATQVEAKRHDDVGGVWLDIVHDGWRHVGLTHARRLFLDAVNDELRGEDSLTPIAAEPGAADGPRRYLPFAVRFHLHPEARASIARDGKSVLIRGPNNIGWWLRNDAVDVAIAPTAHFDHGLARKAGQVVLKSQVRPEVGAKIRWKLTRAEG